MWNQGVSPGRIVIWVICLLTVAFLFAPIIIIMIISFNDSQFMQFPPRKWSLRWYENFFTSPHWYEPALLSLQIATITMINATILGTLAAAHAEQGDFAAAVRIAHEALQRAREAEEAEVIPELQRRLGQYENKQPTRE